MMYVCQWFLMKCRCLASLVFWSLRCNDEWSCCSSRA